MDPVRGDDDQSAYVIAAYSIRTQDVADLRDAIQAAAIRDQLIRAVAHEVRTPLAAQLMWLSIFMGPTFTATQRAKAADAIQSNALEMSQIMGDVVELTRVISGELQLDLSSVEIGALLQEVSAPLGLELSVEPALGPVIGSAPRLRSALTRLLTELVAGCPSGSRVVLSARRDAENIVILVSGQQTPPPHGLGHQLHVRLFELMGGSLVVAIDAVSGMTVTIRLRRSMLCDVLADAQARLPHQHADGVMPTTR